MKYFSNHISLQVALLSFVFFFSNCTREDISEVTKKALPVNTFGMRVNGKAWEPAQVGTNECLRTYHAAWSKINYPYFNIVAYMNPEGLKTDSALNLLQLQIMNVTELGKYELMGSYLTDFKPYAFFLLKKPDGGFIRYVNKRDVASFYVEFERFIPRPRTDLHGVIGSFYGTLYNEANPLDSVIITSGRFTFNKTNHYDFNQCDYFVPVPK
ncbi:MAG: DUF5025 domain-containing protein [Pedobacter sp.]